MEPLPKQGCETAGYLNSTDEPCRLSGTPAEAGVREGVTAPNALFLLRLSGTPAEAGVRGGYAGSLYQLPKVSVEPLPKQGCEWYDKVKAYEAQKSQWNPCRSRGARPPLESFDITGGIGILIHPPTNRFTFCDFKEHLLDFTSN